MSASNVGLVMEGGSMRGMFTAGVLDELMENGITFPAAIGVSAGACFGCNIKSHQIGRVIRYNTRFCKDPRYAGLRSFLLTGDVYGADFCYRDIPDKLDVFDRETFRANPMAFWVVATDVETGKPVYRELKTGDEHDLLWMRASASMPLVSRVVSIDGGGYLDGGISDPIPLRRFEENGYVRNLVIVTQPAGYIKQPSKLMPAFRTFMRRYPAIVDAMASRHARYNEVTAYVQSREQAGMALVIRPDHALDTAAVERDADKLRAVYAHGREVALRELARIRAFMAE